MTTFRTLGFREEIEKRRTRNVPSSDQPDYSIASQMRFLKVLRLSVLYDGEEVVGN